MGILDIIFPKRCLECKKSGFYICKTCLNKVPKPFSVCPVCLRFSKKGKTHLRCKKEFDLDGLISFWRYKGVIRKAIIALKYKFAFDIAREISEITIIRLKEEKFTKSKKAILLPIPAYWYRKNWRGFNQTEVLGREICRKMSWRYIDDLIIRKKYSKPQTELRNEERQENIKGVFILNPKYKLKSKNRIFVVLDDVWTTGSTIKEAVGTLKRKGIKKVWGMTLAR